MTIGIIDHYYLYKLSRKLTLFMPMFNTHDISYGIMPANSFIN